MMKKSPKLITIVLYAVYIAVAVLSFEFAVLRVRSGNNAALSFWAFLPAAALLCGFGLSYVNSRANWIHPIALTLIAVLTGTCFGMHYDTVLLIFFAGYVLAASAIGSSAASIYKQWKAMQAKKASEEAKE